MINVIEVINKGIKINVLEAKTIRMNESTWNRFKEFANNYK